VSTIVDVYLCDDNDYDRKTIENLIIPMIKKHNLNLRIRLSTNNFQSIYNRILDMPNTPYRQDIIFMDYLLGNGVTGVMLSTAIRNKFPLAHIIMVTDHESSLEEAVNALVMPSGFILKHSPNMNLLIEQKLIEIYEHICNQKIVMLSKEALMTVDKKILGIKPSQAVYLTKEKGTNYINIVTNASETIKLKASFKKSLKDLGENFVYANRCIVNTDYIDYYSPITNLLTLETGINIDISKDLLNYFLKWEAFLA